MDASNTMQNVQSFSPTNWMWKPLSSETNEKLLKAMSSPGEGFRKTCDAVIESCINLVLNQHKGKIDNFLDEIIKRRETANLKKICVERRCETDGRYCVCRNCGESVEPPKLSMDTEFSLYKCF